MTSKTLAALRIANPLAQSQTPAGGILLVNKPKGKTSFHLVSILRRLTGIRKIGHAGTLDPFATGVMIMLIGQTYTRLSNSFLEQEKEYLGKLHLGISTDTFDCEGQTLATSPHIPSLHDIQEILKHFQGTLLQTPPMFSAKKVGGKKLYELARKGITIERAAVPVTVQTELLSYHYPHLEIYVRCSKGTYLRSMADEIGQKLHCGAHLCELTRMRSGAFSLSQCVDAAQLCDLSFPWQQALQTC